MTKSSLWRTHLATLFVASALVAVGLVDEMKTISEAGNFKKTRTLNSSVAEMKGKQNIPAMLNSTSWLENSATLTSLKEFLAVTAGQGERKLLEALLDDEINNTNPFDQLSSHYPLAILLDKGVKDFRRRTFRTNRFIGEDGYDLVVYNVIHKDGMHSEVMAYLAQDSGGEASLESQDLSPIQPALFVLFTVSESTMTTYYNLYRDNHLQDHGSLDAKKALALVSQRVSSSVPFMALSSR